jgi:hypothetical protein
MICTHNSDVDGAFAAEANLNFLNPTRGTETLYDEQ